MSTTNTTLDLYFDKQFKNILDEFSKYINRGRYTGLVTQRLFESVNFNVKNNFLIADVAKQDFDNVGIELLDLDIIDNLKENNSSFEVTNNISNNISEFLLRNLPKFINMMMNKELSNDTIESLNSLRYNDIFEISKFLTCQTYLKGFYDRKDFPNFIKNIFDKQQLEQFKEHSDNKLSYFSFRVLVSKILFNDESCKNLIFAMVEDIIPIFQKSLRNFEMFNNKLKTVSNHGGLYQIMFTYDLFCKFISDNDFLFKNKQGQAVLFGKIPTNYEDEVFAKYNDNTISLPMPIEVNSLQQNLFRKEFLLKINKGRVDSYNRVDFRNILRNEREEFKKWLLQLFKVRDLSTSTSEKFLPCFTFDYLVEFLNVLNTNTNIDMSSCEELTPEIIEQVIDNTNFDNIDRDLLYQLIRTGDYKYAKKLSNKIETIEHILAIYQDVFDYEFKYLTNAYEKDKAIKNNLIVTRYMLGEMTDVDSENIEILKQKLIKDNIPVIIKGCTLEYVFNYILSGCSNISFNALERARQYRLSNNINLIHYKILSNLCNGYEYYNYFNKFRRRNHSIKGSLADLLNLDKGKVLFSESKSWLVKDDNLDDYNNRDNLNSDTNELNFLSAGVDDNDPFANTLYNEVIVLSKFSVKEILFIENCILSLLHSKPSIVNDIFNSNTRTWDLGIVKLNLSKVIRVIEKEQNAPIQNFEEAPITKLGNAITSVILRKGYKLEYIFGKNAKKLLDIVIREDNVINLILMLQSNRNINEITEFLETTKNTKIISYEKFNSFTNFMISSNKSRLNPKFMRYVFRNEVENVMDFLCYNDDNVFSNPASYHLMTLPFKEKTLPKFKMKFHSLHDRYFHNRFLFEDLKSQKIKIDLLKKLKSNTNISNTNNNIRDTTNTNTTTGNTNNTKQPLSPNNVKELLLDKDTNLYIDINDLKNWNSKINDINYEAIDIRCLNTPTLLEKESNDMNHCVRSYSNQINSGRSMIFHLNVNGQHSTLQIVLDYRFDILEDNGEVKLNIVNSINQHKLKNNKTQLTPGTKHVAKVINQYLKHVFSKSIYLERQEHNQIKAKNNIGSYIPVADWINEILAISSVTKEEFNLLSNKSKKDIIERLTGYYEKIILKEELRLPINVKPEWLLEFYPSWIMPNIWKQMMENNNIVTNNIGITSNEKSKFQKSACG